MIVIPDIPNTRSSLNASSNVVIDLEVVLGQPNHLVSLEDFLAESHPIPALSFWLTEFCAQKPKSTEHIKALIHQSIADIDESISELLNCVIHHPKLQKLEASWRGLWNLVEEADGTKNTKIKCLDISWAEVSKDIARAMEFDQSHLFQKIYSEEYGTPGGEPYGALIGDYEISHRPSKTHRFNDVSTLEGLSQIAAAAFSPFITGASYELFGVNSYADLGRPINYREVFKQQEYLKWNALRDKSDSRFIGITMPRVLIRRQYTTQNNCYKGVYFKESKAQDGSSHYLWGNACYAFAGILIREFENVGWFGHIRGVPRNQVGGGLLANMCLDYYSTDKPGLIAKPITEVVITDSAEKDLSELGLVPLCQCYDVPFAAFYNNQSLQRPKTFTDKETNINARLSAMLQHVLCGSRIAHYIKIMFRDKIGSFLSAPECESYLRKWLFKYTTGREDLEWEEQARFPLRKASVNVREHPAKPGQYVCVIHIVPHYQIDQMVSELELITELAQVK